MGVIDGGRHTALIANNSHPIDISHPIDAGSDLKSSPWASIVLKPTMSVDLSHLKFSHPAKKIKALNVGPIPQRIFDGMKKYEEAVRGYNFPTFERKIGTRPQTLILGHRPLDAQTMQVFRMPADTSSTELQRLTYFDTGAGVSIRAFCPIIGEDWRGRWRAGGALMVMDVDGKENFQLWRYWEDSESEQPFPHVHDELENKPGVGRFERITNDNFKHQWPVVSESNKLFAFSSNRENGKDFLVYLTKLIDSKTGASADSSPLTLPSNLVTPVTGEDEAARWSTESISIDDRYMLLTKSRSSAFVQLYLVNISGSEPATPELITLPDTTENEEETAFENATFSRDPANPHTIFLVTNAYGNFSSVIKYDIHTRSVLHITTPGPSLRALRPISWETAQLQATKESIIFRANVDGWQQLYVMPLAGPHKDIVIEVRLDWEGGSILYSTNAVNGKPNELALKLTSYRSSAYIAHLDMSTALEHVEKDEDGLAFLSVQPTTHRQAAAALPEFRTLRPTLMRFKSFDGLEVPFFYYHPNERKSAVPFTIQIHGGPEGQSTSQSRIPIHGYLLNELGCAVIYPNVRGSSGYGKKYMAADSVEKREDSVQDIGALLEHIKNTMGNELDSSRAAVMGGSYGGYMVYACLVNFSAQLACGVANFGIGHWPSFLENTADHRRDFRRRKYGDERVPEVRAMLERISPINNADKITIPLSIAHGENDTRIPVGEAIRMYEIVSKKVHVELMVCEKEGHGFKQKSVIEFTNAAKLRFLERFLFSKSGADE
ncbi:alpha/beta-hydrolase [Artomyces pyxidatus]|uniref:Alpha/beta-hydrolase n=1 Tax=Artomyces pyxidatus TaxID=48021 RepID=A0ACB8SS49_9AGAM|nr:alpha/beta-hydrolase [Artomyces pyxidatus]